MNFSRAITRARPTALVFLAQLFGVELGLGMQMALTAQVVGLILIAVLFLDRQLNVKGKEALKV